METEPRIVPESWKLEKETNPKKNNTIKGMFAKQNLKAENKIEDEILKEERLATKKKLELKWKSMKTHHMRLN